MDGRNMTGLLLAITIGAIFFIPVVDVIDGSTGEVQIENETVTENASFDEVYELDRYDIVSDSETVERYNSSDDSWVTLTEGTDYTIDYSNSTVEFVDGGAVSAGDEVRASYTYEATSGVVTTIADLLPLFLALLLLVPMASKIQKEM